MQSISLRWLFSILLVVGCSTPLPFRSPPSAQTAKEDPETKISRDFRREAKKTLKLISDPEVDRYVNQMGQRILSSMGPQPYEYRFFVIEDSQLNAFAVPGGTIYIHTGLIERVRKTDELAGVLGHEIVHVKGRHMARLSGMDPLNLLALLGVFLAGAGAQGQMAGVVGQALAATRQLSYTRSLEQEADTLGVKYVAESGYDPRGILNFLKIIEHERTLNPVDIPPYLMTHPVTQERIAHVELALRSTSPGRFRGEALDPIRRIQTILRLQKYEADAVIRENEKLLVGYPANAEPVHFLGLAYHHKGRLAEARANYERAKGLNPNTPGIDRDLGRLYTQLGEFALARQAFERSLNVAPDESLNYLFLGELFEKEAKFSDAISSYLRAQSLAPLWPEPAQRLGMAYGKTNRLGDAYYYLGRSHFLQDEYEKAMADLARAIKVFGPKSARGQAIQDELDAIRSRGK
ncbi:MAG: M48 family metalloprotease [Deltaproteobacteria bacterium]|nr:M48 family metalloprotease [Deltaproteobacteria bacterium]